QQYETYPWDALVPIPLHNLRLRERGYDQTLLIARTLSENWAIPCREDLIIRIGHRTPQSHLPDHLRRINLKGAFALHPSLQTPPNGKVLLVDDIIHTGATAREAMKVLREAKIDDVEVLAICG
ncbi:MAG: ComF family protein, partial [bacterium]